VPKWEELAIGAIVGMVELVDCLPASRVDSSPWVEGPMCWAGKSKSFSRAYSDARNAGVVRCPECSDHIGTWSVKKRSRSGLIPSLDLATGSPGRKGTDQLTEKRGNGDKPLWTLTISISTEDGARTCRVKEAKRFE
jgi:hypothetical protein